jgi:hypothetical protein
VRNTSVGVVVAIVGSLRMPTGTSTFSTHMDRGSIAGTIFSTHVGR